jgi:hypothetical protein
VFSISRLIIPHVVHGGVCGLGVLLLTFPAGAALAALSGKQHVHHLG